MMPSFILLKCFDSTCRSDLSPRSNDSFGDSAPDDGYGNVFSNEDILRAASFFDILCQCKLFECRGERNGVCGYLSDMFVLE